MATENATRDEHQLERELTAMLVTERFDPPAGFARNANLNDPSMLWIDSCRGSPSCDKRNLT